MKYHYPLHRRHFIKLATLAASATVLPSNAFAADGVPAVLTDLPYSFAALEPHIDARTMEIHHGKHHAGYIKNLNVALESNSSLAKKPLETLLAELPAVSDKALQNALRNNGGGHWNHDFFWKTLTPAAESGKPSPLLAAAIEQSFGGMEDFKKSFREAAGKQFGSGWAWLIVQDGQLKITSTANQDNPAMKGLIPDGDLGAAILGLDVWEHAYYLNYQNRRPDYVTAWWNIANWNVISERYAAAMA